MLGAVSPLFPSDSESSLTVSSENTLKLVFLDPRASNMLKGLEERVIIRFDGLGAANPTAEMAEAAGLLPVVDCAEAELFA